MTRDFSKEALESERAYEIFRRIYLEEGASPVDLAESMDLSRNTVSNYVQGLRKQNLVRKGERDGKKQLYELNEEGILKKKLELWKEPFNQAQLHAVFQQSEGLSFSDEKDIESYFDQRLDENPLESIRNQVGDEHFFFWDRIYLVFYLEDIEESTVQKMLIEDFVMSLIYLVKFSDFKENEELPEFLESNAELYITAYLHLNNAINLVANKGEVMLDLVREAVEDSEDNTLFEKLRGKFE